jgi:hypothetical protein
LAAHDRDKPDDRRGDCADLRIDMLRLVALEEARSDTRWLGSLARRRVLGEQRTYSYFSGTPILA